MSLNRQKIESFRKELLQRRAVIANALKQTNADFINDDVMYADSIDQAAADSDKTLLTQIKARDAQIVAQIDEALRRIDAGGFGECEQCGEDIALARMKVNPATTLCIDCQAELESGRRRS